MPPEPPVAAPEAPPVGAAPPAPPAPPVTEPAVPPVPVPLVPPVPHDVAHDPLHSIVPAGHAQAPLLQSWPSAQRLPHVPQFVGSVIVLVHAVPHMEAQGFSRLLASSVWTAFFVTGVVAKFLWGFLIERIGVRRALVLLFCGEAFGLWLLLTAHSPIALFV